MHTTSTALEMCILYLVKCGIQYQNELFDEINNIIGNENNYENLLKYQNKLLKFGSFINEILRTHAGTAALGLTLPRRITKHDIKIGVEDSNNKYVEYNIPKNTMVVANYTAIRYDKDYWESELNGKSVYEFDPKRFLKSVETNESIIDGDASEHGIDNKVELMNKTNKTIFGIGL